MVLHKTTPRPQGFPRQDNAGQRVWQRRGQSLRLALCSTLCRIDISGDL